MSIGDRLSIRPERPEDVHSIREVNVAAFGRPGHPADEADIVDALRDHGKAVVSLVAEVDGQVAGHVLFSPLRFEPEQPPLTGIALGPIAVRPALQRRGIGSALVRAGLEVCARLGYGSVFLVGDPAYYGRFGFRPARLFGIHAPGPAADAFQAVELHEGALAGVAGTAFEAEELMGPAADP